MAKRKHVEEPDGPTAVAAEEGKRKHKSKRRGDAAALEAAAAPSAERYGAPAVTGGAAERPAAAGEQPAAAPPQQQHEPGAAQEPTAALPKPGGKPAPVLPWMRVPVAIEASEGILLEEVRGLEPRLRGALEGAGLGVPSGIALGMEARAGGGRCSCSCRCSRITSSLCMWQLLWRIWFRPDLATACELSVRRGAAAICSCLSLV